MKKTSFLIIIALFFCLSAESQIFTSTRKIICYFTNPVDTSVAVARGPKAVSLIRSAGDTIMAYINRAKYTIDIALFDYVGDSTWYEGGYVPPIYQAINNAYSRGVKIRWICNSIDSSSGFCNALTPNYGLAKINHSIPVLQSPSGGSYTIMHDKFMVIDGKSSNPDDAIVWTGSMNWEPGQIDKDKNNIIIIQDSRVAGAYLTEFNQMWGDTAEGGTYNLSKSKFGKFKQDLGLHHFLVGANQTPVEVYFSPQDTTNNHILSSMELAQSEIDVSMFTFTYNADATQMLTEQNGSKHIYVSCLMDQSSQGYSPYSTLSAGNGLDTLLQIYVEGSQTPAGCSGTAPLSINHNKYMIVDPCDFSWNPNPTSFQSSPLVLTGSHNWSASANTSNDENTVIVHDPVIANLYYQSYLAVFMGSESNSPAFRLTQHCSGGLGINEVEDTEDVNIYPNPAHTQLSVTANISSGNDVQYKIYNVMGQIVLSGKLQTNVTDKIDVSHLPTGIFLMIIQNGNNQYSKKFCKE